MAETIKILGQSAPSATTATTLYTVPASTTTVVSTISICNRANTMTTFRLWFAINGAGDANAQYVAYDVEISGNDSCFLTSGFTLGAGDLIRIYALTADLSFSAFGTEIT